MLVKCPVCPKYLVRGWRMPCVSRAGAFRHMTCECGVEAWIRKEPNKAAVVFNFRSAPGEQFRSMPTRQEP